VTYAQRLVSDRYDPDYQRLLDKRKLDPDAEALLANMRVQMLEVTQKLHDAERFLAQFQEEMRAKGKVSVVLGPGTGPRLVTGPAARAPTVESLYRTMQHQQRAAIEQVQRVDDLTKVPPLSLDLVVFTFPSKLRDCASASVLRLIHRPRLVSQWAARVRSD